MLRFVLSTIIALMASDAYAQAVNEEQLGLLMLEASGTHPSTCTVQVITIEPYRVDHLTIRLTLVYTDDKNGETAWMYISTEPVEASVAQAVANTEKNGDDLCPE